MWLCSPDAAGLAAQPVVASLPNVAGLAAQPVAASGPDVAGPMAQLVAACSTQGGGFGAVAGSNRRASLAAPTVSNCLETSQVLSDWSVGPRRSKCPPKLYIYTTTNTNTNTNTFNANTTNA